MSDLEKLRLHVSLLSLNIDRNNYLITYFLNYPDLYQTGLCSWSNTC